GFEGRRLAQPLSWEFETRRPVIDRWSLSEGALIGAAEAVVLQFSIPVSLDKIQKALRVTAGGAAAAFELSRPNEADDPIPDVRAPAENKIAVRPRPRWPAAAHLQIALTASVLNDDGNLPMRAAWRRTFQVQAPLALDSVTCGEAPGPIRIGLS